MRSIPRFVVMVVMAGALLVGTTGCDPYSLSAGFVGGWLAGTGNLFGSSETLCFRNGVPIDCGMFPLNLAP